MNAHLIPKDSKTSLDYTIKCVLVGEPFVGKSTILDILSGEEFRFCRNPTIGIEFNVLHGIAGVGDDQTHYKIQVWDCAGQDRFRSIVKSYFRGANVVLAVFDVTNRKSFDMITTWIKEVREQTPNKVIIGILGNKVDLQQNVSNQEAQNLVCELDCEFYFPVSAASKRNIEEVMNKSIGLVHKQNLDGIIHLKCIKTGETGETFNLSNSKFLFAKSRCSTCSQ